MSASGFPRSNGGRLVVVVAVVVVAVVVVGEVYFDAVSCC